MVRPSAGRDGARRPGVVEWSGEHLGARPKHRELGLTDHEFELICDGLEREPNDVELAMFSLLWSEHCAYKHSRKLLRRLPDRGRRGSSWVPARTPGRSTSAVASRSPSRSSPTTTRARSSPSRAPRPASAASSATSSRSAPGRSRCSTRCASASSTRRARATCSTTWSPGSATTATRSACRRSAARSTSRRPTSRTASSTRCASAWPGPSAWSGRRRRASAT